MSLLITAIILAKNEEKYITECIKSLSFCDKILIIDDHSKDTTVEVVNKLGNKKIKVISHLLNDDFSQSRNFALEKVQSEWVLSIDADEIISEALAFEISSVISSWTNGVDNNYEGFFIRRIDFIWKRELKYGESGKKLLRLAKKNAGTWVGKVHEEWKIKGKVGLLNNPIIHYPHQTIEEFLKEINYYTDIRAQELFAKKIKGYWLTILFYPVGKFVVNYFIKRGFLDKIPGLVFAITMSFHSFLVKGKLWLMWNKK